MDLAPSKQVKILDTGYVPRSWQTYTHPLLKRKFILVVHRRGTKSVFSANEIIDQSTRFRKIDPISGKPFKDPQYAFVATTVGQVEKIAWKYFKQYMQHIPKVEFNNSKLRIVYPHEFGWCTIFLMGAENFDAHRGIYLDGYILDEYADMHPDVRDKVLLPTISDRKGWEGIIGTPKGANAFKDLYNIALENPDMWYSALYTVEDTGLIDDEELRMLKASMSDEAFQQEYMCDFNAVPSGKYYEKYIQEATAQGRIREIPYNPSFGVSTFWDIGISDSMAIWFIQEVAGRPHVINYLEWHGRGIEYIAKELHKLPYVYNEHVVPHDADHRDVVFGKKRVDFMREFGLNNIRVVPKTNSIADDIHAVRMVLPLCVWDKEACSMGLKSLNGYERKFDAKLGRFMDSPIHNWASHGADAWRTFCVYYQPGFGRSSTEFMDSLPDECDHDFDPLEI